MLGLFYEIVYIGVDFGGSHVSAAAVSRNGRLLSEIFRLPIDRLASVKTIVEAIANVVMQAIDGVSTSNPTLNCRIAGIGIGCPGPMDMERGVILDTPNIPALRNFPLASALSSHFDLMVKINNDANVAVAGESFAGAGKDCRIVYGCTLGTGFGHGLVINGQIISGANDMAMEHACTPYLNGTIEDYVSGRFISQWFKSCTGINASAKEIDLLARENNQDSGTRFLAIRAYEEFGKHLAYALSWMINALNPDVIVLLGNLAHGFDLFEDWLLDNLSINDLARQNLRLEVTKLWEQAPIIGAASLIIN